MKRLPRKLKKRLIKFGGLEYQIRKAKYSKGNGATMEDFKDMMETLKSKESENVKVEYFNNGNSVLVTSDWGVLAMSSESWDKAIQDAVKNFDYENIKKEDDK